MSTSSSKNIVQNKQGIRPAFVVVWLLTIVLTAILIALGSWQIARLGEKKQLIAQVEARAYGEAANLPQSSSWATIGPKADWEYSRVSLTGTFDHAAEVQVYTVTDIGPGYWVLTPLKLQDGASVIVNRGFVPTDMRLPNTRPEGQISGEVTITGLMRATETGGLFLRENDLENQRYYRRDIEQIARAKGVSNAAPFYVDADSAPNAGGYPVGGKTQLKFPNSHLSYAITWFILAAMMLAAGWFVGRNLNTTKSSEEDI